MNRIVLIFTPLLALLLAENQIFGQIFLNDKPIDIEGGFPKHTILLDARGNIVGMTDNAANLLEINSSGNTTLIALTSDSAFSFQLSQNRRKTSILTGSCADAEDTSNQTALSPTIGYWVVPDSSCTFLIHDTLTVKSLNSDETPRQLYAVHSKILFRNSDYHTLAIESIGPKDPVYSFLTSLLVAPEIERMQWTLHHQSIFYHNPNHAKTGKINSTTVANCGIVYCFQPKNAVNDNLRGFLILNNNQTDSLVLVYQLIQPNDKMHFVYIQHLEKKSGGLFNVKSDFVSVAMQLQDKSEMLYAEKKTFYTQLNDSIASAMAQTADDLIPYDYTPALEVNNSLKNRKGKGFAALIADGYIPFGIVDFDISKFFGYNDFEGPKFGIGLQTNHRFSKKLGVAAALGAGIWTQKLFYNYGFVYNFEAKSHVKFSAQQYAQYLPSGQSAFDGSQTALFNDNSYKNLYVNKMDFTRSIETHLDWAIRKDLLLSTGYAHQSIQPGYEYGFVLEQTQAAATDFHVDDVKFGLRYRFPIAHSKNGIYKSCNQSDEIELILNGGTVSGTADGLSYLKIECRARKYTLLGKNGILESEARLGLNSRSLPYFKLFNIPGTWSRFSVFAPGSFSTMKPNEFASDQYISISINYQQRNSIVGKGIFRPRLLLLVQAVGGKLTNEDKHLGIAVHAPEKGFFEAGFGIYDLLKAGDNGLGVGYFQRVGNYRQTDDRYNFAVKLFLTIGSSSQRNPSFF